MQHPVARIFSPTKGGRIATANRYELNQRAQAMADTRQRITRATVELHQTLGPARTSVSEIARRAGVDRVTVYRHFPDDAALLAACSADFRARNPLPDIARWSTLTDPRQRLRRGLRDLYGYYEQTGPMLANVIRDAEHMPALRAAGAPRRQWLARAEEQLAQGRQGNPRQIRHAIAIALDFCTWRTLTGQRGLTRSQAIRLMLAMVDGAAQPMTTPAANASAATRGCGVSNAV
jgi:AcrR family transcriptional regulator